MVPWIAVVGGIGATALAVSALLALLRAIYTSVPLVPPTPDMLRSERHERSALLRAYPSLIRSIAWRSLVRTESGATPVHRCSVTLPESGRTAFFWAKREDVSAPLRYAGNKVRTLEFSLACIEAKLARRSSSSRARDGAGRTLVLGSGGSNFVLATVAHARRFGARLGASLEPLWVSKDKNSDADNTLNVLSALSFSEALAFGDEDERSQSNHISRSSRISPDGRGAAPRALWAERCGGATALRKIGRALLCERRSTVLPPGGNSIAGALGHVGAALELAEQIASGAAPSPTEIYLTVGSGCTLVGLVVGIALARARDAAAFAHLDALHAQVCFYLPLHFKRILLTILTCPPHILTF